MRGTRRTVEGVDNRSEVREFLTTRRARIRPEEAGLPAAGKRRVPGLRRSEVAALANMSVEYYAKLERGALAGVSTTVLDALARALRLDDAERAHLLRLAHEADGSNAILRPARRSKQWTIRPSLQWSLDAIVGSPAILVNARQDLLAANHLGRAMYSDVYATEPDRTPNFGRFTFLHDAARTLYPDWNHAADMTKILTRREMQAVLADLKRKEPRSKNTRLNLVIFRLSACCGLRASEIANLQFADVRTAADAARSHGE